jgi:hypothetical protein
MTREEEQQMLRYVRGLHNYKVRGPKILFGLGLGVCAFAVGMPVLIGVLAAVAALLHRFIQ